MSGAGLSWRLPGFEGRLGVARRDITPPAGIYSRNWGAASHDLADGCHRPLLCTVLTVRAAKEQTPLLLVAIDGSWFRGPEGATLLRERICSALGVPDGALMLALSHTHSGPSLSPAERGKPGGELIEPYLERVARAVIDGAREALAGEADSILEFATGRCSLAADRDLPDPQGQRLVCGFNPDGVADDTCLVGRVTRQSDGRIIGTLVNYACHPTTLGAGNRRISPDYVGAMRELVEAWTGGAPCLFLQGASGELAPRIQYTDDPAIADAHGRWLGHAVLGVLEGMLPAGQVLRFDGVVESGAPLAMWSTRAARVSRVVDAVVAEVELPLKQSVRSEQVIRAEMEACTDRAAGERLHRELLVSRTVGSGPYSRRRLWVWRLGDVVLIGQSDEAYSRLQTEVRRAFPGLGVVVMNVVNGWGGYLCPSARYDQQVYQSRQSPYARGCLELVIERATESVRSLCEPGRANGRGPRAVPVQSQARRPGP